MIADWRLPSADCGFHVAMNAVSALYRLVVTTDLRTNLKETRSQLFV